MHRRSFSFHVAGTLAALMLLFLAAGPTEAQTCAEKLDTMTKLAHALDTKVKDQQDVIDKQDKKINDQRQLLDQQDLKIDKQRETIANLDSTIGELRKQIALLEDNVKLSQQNAQSQQDIATINAAFIEVQGKAIDALVKTGKRSALEKLVDSLPSVAGIIAIALTHR